MVGKDHKISTSATHKFDRLLPNIEEFTELQRIEIGNLVSTK